MSGSPINLGTVVGFSYLWASEYNLGIRDALKSRPCIVILFPTVPPDGEGVIVVPISHSPSYHTGDAYEIPDEAKSLMGLDQHQQWVSISECNCSRWPSTYLRNTAPDGSAIYGQTPPVFLAQIKIGIERNLPSFARIIRP